MQKTPYIWHNGQLIHWDGAQIHSFVHSLHYGAAAFEGVRAYETDQGPAVFRLQDHTKRFFYSASVIHLDMGYNHEEINQGIADLVAANKLKSCYIRPIAYFSHGKMGVSPEGSTSEVTIACWPWDSYLPHETVDIKTTTYRKPPPSVTNLSAKLSGNYLNAIFAKLELKGTAYHEGLMLDLDGFIAEGPAENFFMVKDGVLFTPHLRNILPGITRDTVINLAQSFGIKVVEKDLTLEDAYLADETFFTGTAAEVSPIGSIDDKKIANGKPGPISIKLRDTYADVVRGKNNKFAHYLTWVANKK